MADSSTTLFIETAQGIFMRRIAPASVLSEAGTPGPAAEAATRGAAAIWGLPDFVFRPALRHRGSSVRELGDAILISGNRAACIQVKARAAPSGREDRERAWLDRNIAQAARQSAGTIRNMSRGRVTLINARGRSIELNGSSKVWSSVTVLDHPGIDGYVPKGASVVLLRRDWEFLFDQLKSTYAVLEYLNRVERDSHVALGTEPVRYYQLAGADLNAPKGMIDRRLEMIGGEARSVPLLPLEPVAHGEIIRGMLEDIAECEVPEGTDPGDLLGCACRSRCCPGGISRRTG